MNIHLENVNIHNTSGPNHFAAKLVKYLDLNMIEEAPPDLRLCFIESYRSNFDNIPLVQRLDGIYFNKEQDYKNQNSNIRRTYEHSNGVIYQTQFNKELIIKYFGEHKNSIVIQNGADLEYINDISALENKLFDKYETIWCSASSWRPHKRLEANINYFLSHAGPRDLLVVAGHLTSQPIKDERIVYTGQLNVPQLISLYKRCEYFIHLAWLDHCPNVVVDARASGCKIVCSNSGGTKEIAGLDAILIEETEEWDYRPTNLYNPPKLDFSRRIENKYDSVLCMRTVAKKYEQFIRNTYENFHP